MTAAHPTLDPAAAVAQAVQTVRDLMRAGLLDPAALGLSPAGEQGSRPLVPGDRIRLRDLVVKTLRGLEGSSSRRTYETYLTFLAEGWPAAAPPEEKLYPGLGDRWADEVLASDLEQALGWVERRAVLSAAWRAERREAAKRAVHTSGGAGARYNAVSAWRRLFSTAVKDRHLAKEMNPALDVAKPRRSYGSRRPLKDEQMQQFWELVGGTGDDPELDVMLCQTILISGARREGLFNLTLGGIDLEECTVRLDEKFGKVVDQPVPDWFARELHAFALSRGAHKATDAVFRTRPRNGRPPRPATARRLDYIFQRLQAAYAWADRAQVSAHVLRHHAIALVERQSKKAVSLAFARHEPEDTNDRYGRASAKEVAQAVVALHGGTHPLLHSAAKGDGDPSSSTLGSEVRR